MLDMTDSYSFRLHLNRAHASAYLESLDPVLHLKCLLEVRKVQKPLSYDLEEDCLFEEDQAAGRQLEVDHRLQLGWP
jgi:hypothetical protein